MTVRPQREIRALTGLRGVAAAYVMLFHFSGAGRTADSAFSTFRSHGYLAVDVFFVLSGFVMALTYGAQFTDRFRPERYRVFLVKRLGRVYPAYLVATLACMALSLIDPAQEGPLILWGAVTNLFMIQAWGLSYSLDYPGWSVSSELAAYLLFPLLAAATLGGRSKRPLVAVVVAAVALAVLATLPDVTVAEVGSRIGPLDVWASDTAYPVLRCLAGFVLGLCAWRLSLAPRLRHVLRRPGAGSATGLLLVVLLALPRTDVAVVLVTAGFVSVVAQERSWLARMLAAGPIHWLGVVSYSLYLVHYPLAWALGPAIRTGVEQLGAPWPGAVAMSVLAGCSIGCAALSYRWIERPGRALSRSVLLDDRPVAAPVIEAGAKTS